MQAYIMHLNLMAQNAMAQINAKMLEQQTKIKQKNKLGKSIF